MKIKGSELILFTEQGWPGAGTEAAEDWYWDSPFEEIEPDQTYDTSDFEEIRYQGRGEDPTSGEGYDVTKSIRAWRRSRDFTTLTVTVTKSAEADLRGALSAIGAKIISEG
ncbi:hypothetical protein V5G24_20180 [Xanthobacter sp. VTT E-85241]|uniref:hypothetical protein n=1 Tax=Roseixanthobacter finlandensis TaxID=3119922 RepID=UPI0037265E9B